MKVLCENDTIQIEVTNFCPKECANCTRLVGHFEKPYFMPFEMFKEAVDSLLDFPKMIGMMGGEPLYHPQFELLCSYLRSKAPPEKFGLWTSLPEGKESYRETIVQTFGHIFLNDHTIDVLHCPILVGSEEVVDEPAYIYYLADKCWIQNSWSASINPNGAWFCEIAGALSLALNGPKGWKVKPGWWKRTIKDYTSQIEWACPKCGVLLPLKKRLSSEKIDDISPKNYERLKHRSPKLKKGMYEIHNLEPCLDKREMATYKDENYRREVAKRYGMFLVINEQGFQTPYLLKEWPK